MSSIADTSPEHWPTARPKHPARTERQSVLVGVAGIDARLKHKKQPVECTCEAASRATVEAEGERISGEIHDSLIDGVGDGAACVVIHGARELGHLRAMRERAQDCGGSLVVEPGPPRGPRVDVLLPLRGLPE